MERKLIYIGDDRLRQVSSSVTDEERSGLLILAEEMKELMRKHQGLGLAAVQAGVLKKMFLINLNACVGSNLNGKEIEESEKENIVAFLNPVIQKGLQTVKKMEGCRSIPLIRAEIKRSTITKISFETFAGEKKEWTTKGLLSAAVQHEYDHTEGILYPDRLKEIEQKRFWREFKKRIREKQKEKADLDVSINKE